MYGHGTGDENPAVLLDKCELVRYLSKIGIVGNQGKLVWRFIFSDLNRIRDGLFGWPLHLATGIPCPPQSDRV